MKYQTAESEPMEVITDTVYRIEKEAVIVTEHATKAHNRLTASGWEFKVNMSHYITYDAYYDSVLRYKHFFSLPRLISKINADNHI